MANRTLNGLSSSNVYVNTISNGEALEILSSTSTASTANVSMKTNTTEQTTINNNDLFLIADNASGKVLKYIQYTNFVNWLFNSSTKLLYPTNTDEKVVIGATTIADGYTFQNLGNSYLGTTRITIDGSTSSVSTASLICSAGIITKNGASGSGFIKFYDGTHADGSTHYCILTIPYRGVSADFTLNLPVIAGTLALQTDITNATNVATTDVAGNPTRTFANALCATIINGTSISQKISTAEKTYLDANGLRINGSLFLNHAVTASSYAINISGADNDKVRIQIASSNATYNPVLQFKNSGADTEAYIYNTQGTASGLVLLKGTMNIHIPTTASEGIRFLDNSTEIMKITPTAIRFQQDLTSVGADLGQADDVWEDIYCEDIYCQDIFVGNGSAMDFKYSTGTSAGDQSQWSIYQGGTAGIGYRNLHFDFKPTTAATFVGQGYVNAQSGSYVLMNFTGQHICKCDNMEIKNNIDDYVGLIVYSTGEYNSIVADSYTDEDLNRY